jgi:ATP-dependent Clp protease adaptor protein ClpS
MERVKQSVGDLPKVETVQAPTRPELEFIVGEQVESPYRVLVHNDDVTPMDFVVAVLRGIFELALERAEAVMLTAHYTGGALVGTWPRDDAKRRIDGAHSLARLEDYPLKFTMEPEA